MNEPHIEDVLAALDFDPVLKCDAASHSQGLGGCVASESAAYELEIRHPINICTHPAAHLTIGKRYPACRGHAIWVQGRAHDTIMCGSCHQLFAFEDITRVIGPLGKDPQ